MQELAGKIAIIMGVTSGLGLATVTVWEEW